MLKPIAAGLMCVGFVTLGVAISRGQDNDSDVDLIVIDGKLSATEVKVDDAQENPAYVAEPSRISARFARGPQVGDPQTREMLDKMTAALKEEIQKLENEGKQEEAQQKMQSLRAIESLLHDKTRGAAVRFTQRHHEANQTMDEMKKLHWRLNRLVEQSSKLPEGAPDDREKLQQEIEKVQKEIAERHQSLTAPAPVGGQPSPLGLGQPFPPGMGAPRGRGPRATPRFHGAGIDFMPEQPPGIVSPEGLVLARHAEALSQAAGRLKESGLDDQARQLLEQAREFRAKAEKMMQAEAEKHRAQAGHGGAGAGGFGPGGFGGGGPPMELHRAIHELQEQIQQLRKEVGELRELLQRRQ